MNQPKITIYGTTTCAYCFALKDWLDETGFNYDYYFVDQDQQKADEMIAISGGNSAVPFTTITFEDGRVEPVLGFDRDKFIRLLGM
jgi:glutaredoxin